MYNKSNLNNLKVVKANTKFGKRLIEQYQHSNERTLFDIYHSWSIRKQETLTECYQIQYKYDGKDGRITSFNTMQFTYAFRCGNNSRHLMVITKENIYFIYSAFKKEEE